MDRRTLDRLIDEHVALGHHTHRPTPPTDTIRQLLATDPFWSTMNPREINSGDCEQFMADVCERVLGAEERTTGPFLGPNDEEIAGPLDHLDVGHYWIEFEGRHDDAECPGGVDRPEDLPIFRRAAARKSAQT